ncbi:MAG: hypothetical protein ACF8R7_12595 [Phycisphaerales bacterium JB039]
MRRTSMLTLAVLIGLAAAVGAGAPGSAREPALPYVQLIGPDSAIVERGFHRIRDQQAWHDLWKRHIGEDPVIAGINMAPEIDFDRCEVIAFFRGKATNTRGERVEAIDDLEGHRRIRFDASTYQTASLFEGEPDHGDACTPYGLWVIERTDSAIVIEENVQGLIGKPAIWQEKFRFEAPTD